MDGLNWAQGISNFGGAIADVAGEQIKHNFAEQIREAEEQRNIRAEQRKEQTRRDGGEYDYKVGQERRKAQANELEDAAGLLAGKRVIEDKDAVSKADAEAIRINDMLSKKKITQAQADEAYRNIEKWKDEFSTKNTEVTQDDRTQAAIQSGIISPKDAATLNNKDAAVETRMKIAELQNSAAFAKMDAQTQVALAKLDAAIAKGSASGHPPTQVQQIEYLISNGMDREKATSLVYHPEGKVGEYDTVERERDLPGGGKEKIISKRKPSDLQNVKNNNDPLGIRRK